MLLLALLLLTSFTVKLDEVEIILDNRRSTTVIEHLLIIVNTHT
jgi:hypothetical protein